MDKSKVSPIIALAWEICQIVAKGKRFWVGPELRGRNWESGKKGKSRQGRVQRGESSELGLQKYADISTEGFIEYWSVRMCEEITQGQGKQHPKELEEYIPESKEPWELLFTAAKWKTS